MPRRALVAVRANGVVALSAAVFRELATVLARPKFTRIVTDYRRREILELLTVAAVWLEPMERVVDCRDLKDNCLFGPGV